MKPSVRKILLNSAAPYSGAQLVLDFVGSRSNGQPYYMLNGAVYPLVDRVPGWTYSGGASTGCYAPRLDGSLQFFPQNVPRITDAGYWAEEARTNLLLYSQAFTTGGWSNNIVYLTPNQSGAPDGTSTATLFTPPASAGSWDFRQSVTHTVASYTLSIYAKPNGYDRIAFRENTTSGSYVVASLTGAGSILSNSGGTSTITAVANGWYRLTMTWTGAAVSQQMSVYVVGPGYTSGSPNAYSWTPNGTSGVYFWGAQDELGAFATSPIPTTSVAVTRAADVGYVSGIAIPTTGTMVATANVPTTANDQFLAFASDGSLSNRIFVNAQGATGNGASGVFASGVGNTMTVASVITGAARTVAMAYTAGAQSTTANGATPVAGTVATVPSVTRLDVGGGGAATAIRQAQGPIRRIVIYPRAFGNAELQAITTAGAY